MVTLPPSPPWPSTMPEHTGGNKHVGHPESPAAKPLLATSPCEKRLRQDPERRVRNKLEIMRKMMEETMAEDEHEQRARFDEKNKLKLELSSKNKFIERLREQNTGLFNQINSLEKQVGDFKEKNADLDNEVNSLNKHVEEFEKKNMNLYNQVNSLKKQLEESKKKNAALQNTVEVFSAIEKLVEGHTSKRKRNS
ncbi:hypothetical protein DM02DRAFT_668061 [Periconia macrospinosa]|uniref:Uncharacterized protein n=1 Tax=Periconia macrospinosa TaxID=97972 RepID=A0A2V1E5E4_9PLEO|nr:hypothetical protein DM02DRAFT_668061 [Periconia macrospinosa]